MPTLSNRIEAVSKALLPLIRPHVVPVDFRERVVALLEAEPDAEPCEIARSLAVEIVPTSGTATAA